MTSKLHDLGRTLAYGLLAVPIVGVLLGGVYSWPAAKLTNGREPWLTLLLIVGLAVSVGGLGYALGTDPTYAAIAWGVSVILLLLVRKLFGALDRNLERFGIVHVAALTATGLAATFTQFVALRSGH